MLFALYELRETLAAAWEAADLWRRLRSWLWVVRNRDLLDGPAPQEGDSGLDD